MLGTYALSAGYYDAYYGQAQKVRTLIRQDFDRAFQQVDVIAAPVAPTTAFRIGEHRDDPLAMYLEDVFTLPTNLAGVPGLAFPVGFDQQGLPVGIQLMAAHFQEDLLFSVAYLYQQRTDWQFKDTSIVINNKTGRQFYLPVCCILRLQIRASPCPDSPAVVCLWEVCSGRVV